MNSERINQLVEQCGFYVTEKNGQQLYSLIELVVKECAGVIDRGNGEMCSIAEHTWCNICRDDILKHFGLDE